MADVSLSFHGATFQLLPCGALFWPAESMLLAADLHLEKGSSLARDGWMLPPYDSIDTLDRLVVAARRTGCRHLVLLGDSFHDRGGADRLPGRARERLAALADMAHIRWIAGNHDGASAAGLPGSVADSLSIAGIRLVHEAASAGGAPAIAGHFHPKVAVPLRHGRMARRRCLALGARVMILPAYGAFAGGLDVADPAIADACGGPPTAIIATARGLVRLPPAPSQRSVA